MNTTNECPKTQDVEIIDIFQDTSPNEPLRAPVIHGLLREGETMNVISETKVGKSWLVLDLAFSVATGQPWLGAFNVEPGNVLLIDNELHKETLVSRCWTVAEAREHRGSDLAGCLNAVALRGNTTSIFDLTKKLPSLTQHGTYRLIILDALYRFYPERFDENSNSDMAKLYNALDEIGRETGAAIVVVHHASKGAQSSKKNTDVGSGAGAISRAADSHLVFRATKQKNVSTVTASVRSWEPLKPFNLYWNYPVWTPFSDLQVPAAKPKNWSMEEFAALIGDLPIAADEIHLRAKEAGMSYRDSLRFLKQAKKHKSVLFCPCRGNISATYQRA